MYTLHTQKTRHGIRLVLVSPDNNKLVLEGESLANGMDAADLQRNILARGITKGSQLPLGYKFTKNSGPKKKVAKKAAVKKKAAKKKKPQSK